MRKYKHPKRKTKKKKEYSNRKSKNMKKYRIFLIIYLYELLQCKWYNFYIEINKTQLEKNSEEIYTIR